MFGVAILRPQHRRLFGGCTKVSIRSIPSSSTLGAGSSSEDRARSGSMSRLDLRRELLGVNIRYSRRLVAYTAPEDGSHNLVRRKQNQHDWHSSSPIITETYDWFNPFGKPPCWQVTPFRHIGATMHQKYCQ